MGLDREGEGVPRGAPEGGSAHPERPSQPPLPTPALASMGPYLAHIAHEINNPLNCVSGHLHFLREYAGTLVEGLHACLRAARTEPAVRERLEAVHRAMELERIEQELAAALDGCADGIERVAGVVRELREFPRASERPAAPVDLHRALDSTLELLRGRVGGVRIERDYGELPEVECVVEEIERVLVNLLGNALDAVGERGTIRVRTRCVDPERVAVEIEDDGCGIASDRLERVFEPFFSSKGEGRGSGLGLSISRGIVARHGGEIHVRSQPGAGSCFRIELPVRAGRSGRGG